VAGLRQLGKTVFLTTHDLDEAEYLADRITVIAAGRIVAEGTPADAGRARPDDHHHQLHAPGPRASA
jgi:ABC-type multidrug transport system ATPase subunit